MPEIPGFGDFLILGFTASRPHYNFLFKKQRSIKAFVVVKESPGALRGPVCSGFKSINTCFIDLRVYRFTRWPQGNDASLKNRRARGCSENANGFELPGHCQGVAKTGAPNI